MFGTEPFDLIPLSVAEFDFGAIDGEALDVTAFTGTIQEAPTIDGFLSFHPGRSNLMYVDNDTDLIVTGLRRSRDQSPIIDAELFGSLVHQTAFPDITDATNATPIVITATAHGLTTGDPVFINEVEGNIAANGPHVVTVIDADTFELDDTTGDGDYIEGGKIYLGVEGAMGLPLEYNSTTKNYYVTFDADLDVPIGDYFRFVTCDNYDVRFGPTPVTASLRI